MAKDTAPPEIKIMIDGAQANENDNLMEIGQTAVLIARSILAAIDRSPLEEIPDAVVSLCSAVECVIAHYALEGKEMGATEDFVADLLRLARTRAGQHGGLVRVGEPFKIMEH